MIRNITKVAATMGMAATFIYMIGVVIVLLS
ncbi:hypothetical protein ACUXHY_000105 [Cytobacillus horneckiae]